VVFHTPPLAGPTYIPCGVEGSMTMAVSPPTGWRGYPGYGLTFGGAMGPSWNPLLPPATGAGKSAAPARHPPRSVRPGSGPRPRGRAQRGEVGVLADDADVGGQHRETEMRLGGRGGGKYMRVRWPLAALPLASRREALRRRAAEAVRREGQVLLERHEGKECA